MHLPIRSEKSFRMRRMILKDARRKKLGVRISVHFYIYSVGIPELKGVKGYLFYVIYVSFLARIPSLT